jgi:hypothetical protein
VIGPIGDDVGEGDPIASEAEPGSKVGSSAGSTSPWAGQDEGEPSWRIEPVGNDNVGDSNLGEGG